MRCGCCVLGLGSMPISTASVAKGGVCGTLVPRIGGMNCAPGTTTCCKDPAVACCRKANGAAGCASCCCTGCPAAAAGSAPSAASTPSAGLDLPEPPDFLNGHQEGEAPPAAAALLAARDFLLGSDEGGEVDIGSVTRAARKVQPVAQSLYDAPSLRAALIEVLARASERAASRAIRLALKAATDPGALRPVEVEEEAPAPEYPFGYS